MELEYIIVFTVGIILGAIISAIGSIVKLKSTLHEADNYLDKIKELESKVHFYEDHINYYRLAYKKQYNSDRIELKELKNKNNKMAYIIIAIILVIIALVICNIKNEG